MSYLVYTLAFTLFMFGVANILLGLKFRKLKGMIKDVRDEISQS